jgi:dTMP kinase
VFEGPDGVGKSTQVALLADWLREAGQSPVVVREPGGTALGEAVRTLLLHPSAAAAPLDALTEALLFAAARAELVRRVIRPALAAGSIVLADRFTLSTVAYQHFGAGVPRDRVEALNAWATEGVAVDLTILLTAAKPRRADEDAMERREAAFHARVRAGYRKLAREPLREAGAGPVKVIAQQGGPDRVAAAVLDAVRPLLEQEGGRRA